MKNANSIACDCGKPARWRGPMNGLREYSCDECYCSRHTRFYVQSEHVRGEKRHYWVCDSALHHDRYSHGRITELTTSKAQAYYQCANLNEQSENP